MQPLCEKVFSHNSDLKIHLRTHTGKKLYRCSQCEKTFPQNTDLKIHLKIHTVDKPYQCSYCEKAISQNCHLVSHLKTHTRDKPYQCTEQIIGGHTHTVEKPCQCAIQPYEITDLNGVEAIEDVPCGSICPSRQNWRLVLQVIAGSPGSHLSLSDWN